LDDENETTNAREEAEGNPQARQIRTISALEPDAQQ